MGMFEDARVLVAGGAGFVGASLAARLAGMGAKVRATVHRRDPAAPVAGVEYVSADLTEAEDCRRVTEGIDTVFMCAANTQGAAVMVETPLAHVTPNVVMNTRMLEASHRARAKKFVFLSSGAAYPDTGAKPATEVEMFAAEPADVYYAVAWMKRYAEILCQTYAERIKSPMPCLVVRPSNIYGPGDKFDPRTSHVTASLVRRVAERENPMTIWGSGEDIRDLIYIDDFLNGLLLAARRPEAFLAVNLCSGRGHSVKQVLQTAMAVDGFTEAEVRYDASKPSTAPIKLFNGTLARELLGFQPKVELAEGLRRTLDWYRRNVRRS
jgi:GDP-L-fucose synthase